MHQIGIAGNAFKKVTLAAERGIVSRSAYELDQFDRILANQKLRELARRIDEVNPKRQEEVWTTDSDVFEI